MPAGAFFLEVPAPQLLVLGPASDAGLQRFFVLLCLAADPQPAAAKFNLQAVHLQKVVDDLDEVAGALGGGAGPAGGIFGGLLILAALQDLEPGGILGVNSLHGCGVAAHVGVMLLGQMLVDLLQLVQGFAV